VVRFDVVVWARFGMVETVGICQVMWFVMLESANNRVIGVDTAGQQVPHTCPVRNSLLTN
jgi:hypothetical protein